VSVTINGQSKITDTNGAYSFPNIPRNQAVNIVVEKTDAYENGVDGADLILLRRQLLDINPFNSPNKFFAGDVNKDNDVNGADLIFLRRLILGIIPAFPTTAWQFRTVQTTLNPAFPFGVTEPSPLSNTFTGDVSNFDFYGFKTGDVNASADLGQ
jgi:Dockerin type I domain